MIDKVLIEMTRLEAAKETDNKLRWDVDIDDTRFSLYIPKWRVPQPWPSRIWVDGGDGGVWSSLEDLERLPGQAQ